MFLSSLPILSSLGNLVTGITGSVSDEFKKLLQPQSLVAAAFFLTLNLALIYPVLVASRIGFALASASLPIALQLGLATFVLFALSYVLNTLAGFFLSILNGDVLKDSPVLGASLLNWQARRFDRLHRTIDRWAKSNRNNGSSKTTAMKVLESEAARAAYELAFEFPQQRESLAPTRLGNVLLNTASYTRHQYGAHLDTLLPFVDLALKDSAPELRARLVENRTALTFLVSLTVLLGVVAIELFVVEILVRRQVAGVLWAVLILILAFAIYEAAVRQAKAWGRDVRIAFDLHLEEVAKKFGFQEIPLTGANASDARQRRWMQVSEWLAYGATKFDDEQTQAEQAEESLGPPTQRSEWYGARQVPSELQVESPPTIKVSSRSQHERRDFRQDDQRRTFGDVYHYFFAITNEESGEHALPAIGSYLIVSDARLGQELSEQEGRLAAPSPSASSVSVTGKVLSGPKPALFWSIGRVPPRSSRVLQYHILRTEIIAHATTEGFKIESIAEDAKEKGSFKVVVRNTNPHSHDVTLEISLPRDSKLPDGASYDPGNETDPVDRWDLHEQTRQVICLIKDIAGDSTFTLIFLRELS